MLSQVQSQYWQCMHPLSLNGWMTAIREQQHEVQKSRAAALGLPAAAAAGGGAALAEEDEEAYDAEEGEEEEGEEEGDDDEEPARWRGGRRALEAGGRGPRAAAGAGALQVMDDPESLSMLQVIDAALSLSCASAHGPTW